MKTLAPLLLSSCLILSACDSANPFMEETDDTSTGSTDSGNTDNTGNDGSGSSFVIEGGGVPEGVDGGAATDDSSIVRYEERNAEGGGYAEDFAYDSATDTFTVDNLAFDGEGPYTRSTIPSIASLGPNNAFALYNASVTVPDAVDGDAVPQIVPYRAIVGVSNAQSEAGNPRTSFAIVRTGGYINYGFGGFVYQRDGGVVIPTTGQARFDGDYAGMRIFSEAGGLEYVEADMRIDLDFDDPTDAVAGVKGRIYNRVAYDEDGNVIDSTGQGEITREDQLPLPDITFVLDGAVGNASADGELAGDLATNVYLDENGNAVDHESGSYFAILAGDATSPDGGEIVGVAVITSSDAVGDGRRGTVQETGGFILYRDESYNQ